MRTTNRITIALALACASLIACGDAAPPTPDAGPLGEDPGYSEDPRPVDYDADVYPPADANHTRRTAMQMITPMTPIFALERLNDDLAQLTATLHIVADAARYREQDEDIAQVMRSLARKAEGLAVDLEQLALVLGVSL